MIKNRFSSLPIGLDQSLYVNRPAAPETTPDIFEFDEEAIIVDEFRLYLRLVHGRRFYYSGPHPQTGELLEATVPAASTSRYTEDGRKKIKRKLGKRLGKGQTPGVLLTLTIDPKRYSKSEAWELVWQEYASFRRRLWKFLQRKGWKHNPLYVAVLEQHKSAYPHLHVCYPNLRYLAPKEIITSAWRMGKTYVKGSKRDDQSVMVNVRAYVLKYVTKLSGWTEEGLAHLWHARARLFNISPRLYAIPKEPKAPGWQLIKIDYIDEALKDLARRLSRLRFLQPRRRKEVRSTPLLKPGS